jgi:phospholipid/cholesterol/gamma-HCH transport system permease protein
MGVDGALAIRKGFPFGEFIQQCWFIAKVTHGPGRRRRGRGVDPVHRLVLPRLAAATLVALLLNGVVSFSGIAGGWVMAVPLQGGTSGAYFASFTELAQLADFWSALVKAAIFGFLAAAIACHYGYNAFGGPKAVGEAVNKAVVLTFIILFFVNFTLTALYFNAVPPKA